MFTPAPGCKGISPQSLHTNSTFYQELTECGNTYSLDYIIQIYICISKAGLVQKAGVSSLCYLCTCALPPGWGVFRRKACSLSRLFFPPSERAQLLLADFLTNTKYFSAGLVILSCLMEPKKLLQCICGHLYSILTPN